MEKVHKLNEVIYKKMVDLFEAEKYQSAIDMGRSLLENARRLGDHWSEKKALEVLCYASYYTIDYVSAMSYITQYSKLVEEDGILAERIKTYHVFASLYTRQGEYHEARQLLDKVVKLLEDSDLLRERIKNANNYGFFHNTFREYHKAIPHLLEALELCESHHIHDYVPVIHENLALSYIRTGALENAKESLDLIFTRMDSTNLGISRAIAYMLNAELLSNQGDEEEALNQIKASKVISKKYGYTAELAEATMIQSTIYRKMGLYDKACEALESYIDLQTILSDTAKKSAVTRLKMEYDVNRRQIEANLLREQNSILEEQNRKIQEQSNELERLNQVLSQQNDDLHQSAIEDYLTGVFNRKYVTLKMQEEFSICKEKGGNIACILFDIDKFKSINDTYGHLIGDEMIKHVSSICEESLDSDSIIGRYGGDEFIIFMVDADIQEAEEKSNELLATLGESPLFIDKEAIYATLSLGVADNHYMSPKTTDEMLHIADMGLYAAKEKGRNQCVRYVKD